MDEILNDHSIEKIILLNPKQRIENFYDSNSNFFRYGASQTSVRMVDRILNSPKIPIETKKAQLKQLVFQIFNETFLNEVEVAVWALVLESSVWGNEKFELSLSLISSAVFSKELMGEDIEYLLVRFSEKVFDFRAVFRAWKSQQRLVTPSAKTINSMYQYLKSSSCRLINYTYYVDDVIFQYMPYNNPKKQLQPSILIHQPDEEKPRPIILPDFLSSLEPLPLIAGNSGSISNYINLDV